MGPPIDPGASTGLLLAMRPNPRKQPTATYRPLGYWEQLHERDDMSSVGQSSLPSSMNSWLYKTIARNYGRFVRRQGLSDPAPQRVFDVGSGSGYWVAWWQSRGAGRVDGCDLVQVAVDRVNARLGVAKGIVRLADVTDPAGLGSEVYDLVCCQNVLLHITDDAAFRQALTNVAALVAPGGALVVTEPILAHPKYERPYDPTMASRARRLSAYRDPLIAAGLRFAHLEAATVLANNPIEASSGLVFQIFRFWWRGLSRCSKLWPRTAGLLGRIIYHLDSFALLTGSAPTTKFAVFRRDERG